MSDPVNHPQHYTSHPSGVECIQVTEHMGFCLGNAVKYIWRADLKGNAVEELEKARFYINREIERRRLAHMPEHYSTWEAEAKETRERLIIALERLKATQDKLDAALDSAESLIHALHLAIASPKGVVPAMAERFYQPDHPALREEAKG